MKRSGPAPTPLDVRFSRHLQPGPLSEYRPDLGPCLLWIGATNGGGYGQFQYRNRGRTGYAHRYAWERVHGPIPAGLQIDHLCRVRRCVKVSHLEVVDGATNTRRASEARTQCRHGHPLTPENTRRYANGHRRECRTCRRKQILSRLAARRKPADWIDPRIRYDLAKRDELVAKVAKGDMTVKDAAAELGCPAKYIDKLSRAHRRRNGDQTNRAVLPEEKRRMILALLWAGIPKREIGRIFAVSPTSATNIEGRATDAEKHWPFEVD